jgi:hypothetical protein
VTSKIAASRKSDFCISLGVGAGAAMRSLIAAVSISGIDGRPPPPKIEKGSNTTPLMSRPVSKHTRPKASPMAAKISRNMTRLL